MQGYGQLGLRLADIFDSGCLGQFSVFTKSAVTLEYLI